MSKYTDLMQALGAWMETGHDYDKMRLDNAYRAFKEADVLVLEGVGWDDVDMDTRVYEKYPATLIPVFKSDRLMHPQPIPRHPLYRLPEVEDE